MIDAAAVVWLGSASPSDEARGALEGWARARGVRLVEPTTEAARAVSVDWTAAERVEGNIARSREALAGLDFDAAERELARAEATVREHPELPQAAWLRAEVERAWSMRWLRSGDEERARRAWQRAAGLDGGRAPGLGEKAFEPAPPVTATIRLGGPGELWLDGAPLHGEASAEVTRSAGEHVLAYVGADGSVAWAQWVSIAAGTRIDVAPPSPPACSRADFAGVKLDGEAVRAPAVRCGRWVAAIASQAEHHGLRVASCEAGACGPLVEWRVLSTEPWSAGARGRPAEATRSAWPAWATWTIAGVGVAGTVVGILAASGALKSAPNETRFVNGGLQIHSF